MSEHILRVGCAALYGERRRVLEGATPVSVMLAVGGPVVVYPKA